MLTPDYVHSMHSMQFALPQNGNINENETVCIIGYNIGNLFIFLT